jgi:hypothetical protein
VTREEPRADTAWVHRALTLVVPVGLSLVAFVHWGLVQHMAVHLCRWPATVSCLLGVPFVWEVLIGGLWLVALVATLDTVAFVATPDATAPVRIALWAAWGPLVVATTGATMLDRTLHTADLVLGVVLVLAALVLVAATVRARFPVHARALAVLFAGPVIAVALLPAWAPSAFRAAEHPDPARAERHRLRVLEACLQEQERQRASNSDVALPLCEAYPVPTDAGVPPLP